MRNLLLTDPFVKFFQGHVEWIGHKEVTWEFRKKISGNFANYNDLVTYVDYFNQVFDWVSLKRIILPISEKLESDAWDIGTDYAKWKTYVRHKYLNNKWITYDDSDSGLTYIYYNCYYKTLSMMKSELLFLEWHMHMYICIVFYNGNSDFVINFELRGEPFYELPWGKKYPEFTLPLECVHHNRELLKQSFETLYNDNFKLDYNTFELEANPTWKIDEYGFV